MKAIVLLLFCLPLMAAELTGDTIKMTADEVARCAAGGGCVLITVDVLAKLSNKTRVCGKDWT